MRRNSENLLVLGGTDMGKRATHRVALVDVLRAAVTEAEQAERIAVRPPPPLTIAGRVAADLQHLLSELLDNSVSFSPPDSQIRVTSFQPPRRPLYIDVCDAGVSMAPDEMVEANRILAQRAEAGAGSDAARRTAHGLLRRRPARRAARHRRAPDGRLRPRGSRSTGTGGTTHSRCA